MPLYRQYSTAQIECWSRGAEEFNRQRYWHAHEGWETGWTRLPDPDRTHVQSLIQATSVFHLLLELNRVEAALRLCRNALSKRKRLSGLRPSIRLIYPRIEIPGIENVLRMILDGTEWQGAARALRAEVLLAPASRGTERQ